MNTTRRMFLALFVAAGAAMPAAGQQAATTQSDTSQPVMSQAHCATLPADATRVEPGVATPASACTCSMMEGHVTTRSDTEIRATQMSGARRATWRPSGPTRIR